MRTFSTPPYKRAKVSAADRGHRQSLEWDGSIVIDEPGKVDVLLKMFNRGEVLKECTYLMVSGVEYSTVPGRTTTDNYHIHFGVILKELKSRNQLIRLLRKDEEWQKLYLTPRKTQFTYKGWRLHHAKKDTKVNVEEQLVFEYGQLPKDDCTVENLSQIINMIKKYGRPGDKAKLPKYRRTYTKLFTMRKIEQSREILSELEALEEFDSETENQETEETKEQE